MSSALVVSPSPEAAADSRKRRWHGDLQDDTASKRRYAEARRALDWVAHLCARYPGMSDKVRRAAACRPQGRATAQP